MAGTLFDFEPIAGRYDLCNWLCSWGLEHRWRRTAARLLAPRPGERILDVCCGTGQMVRALALQQPKAHIAGLDISPGMLKQAQKKNTALLERITWRLADALQTHLPAAAFDLITCAFGLRNLSDPTAALREMKRLLRPAGRVGILEFSLPRSPFLRAFFWGYLRYLMPAIGLLLFASPAPLVHLAESIREWNDAFDLPGACRQAGLVYVEGHPMCGGLLTLHRILNPPV